MGAKKITKKKEKKKKKESQELNRPKGKHKKNTFGQYITKRDPDSIEIEQQFAQRQRLSYLRR